MKGHWSRTCHTAKHLADLYQDSTKEKGKLIEMNFAYHSDPEYHTGYFDTPNGVDITHLDVSDFFKDPKGNIDHLIGDGDIHTN